MNLKLYVLFGNKGNRIFSWAACGVFLEFEGKLHMSRTVMLANLPIKTLILHTSLPSGDRYLEAGMQKIKGKVGQKPENVQYKN